MTICYDDFTRTQFKSLADVKEFHDFEVSICRMDDGLYLLKEKDGYALMADTTHHNTPSHGKDKEGKGQQSRIKYYNNGDIDIDLSTSRHHRYYWERNVANLLSYLPESVHFYEQRDKIFFIYDKGNDVRRRNYDVTTVYEKFRDLVTLKADGSVKGCKRIDRGEKKWAEDKPMKDQLEPKHFREMTKARLDNDFCIDYNKLYATFRGISTGKFHMALEMHRPSKWRESTGPSAGLIRKLHVVRFADPTHMDMTMAGDLALSICSDIPDSCVGPNLRKMRENSNANKNV